MSVSPARKRIYEWGSGEHARAKSGYIDPITHVPQCEQRSVKK